MMHPDLSPARALLRAASQHPRRPSLIDADTGRVWTVEESAHRVRALAALFSSLGVSVGDRVVISAPNSPWHFLVHIACSWIHAVTVPLSPRLPAGQREHILRECAPTLLITDEAQLGFSGHLLTFARLEEECARREGAPAQGSPSPRASLSTDDIAPAGNCIAGRASSPSDADAPVEDSASSLPPLPPYCHDEAAAIVYTSGSSGTPRGVVLTHAQLWWASASFRDGFEYSPGQDVVGVCAPLSHIGGFNGTSMDTVSHGGTLVIFSTFAPDQVLRSIEKYRISMMFAVPTMCHLLLDAQERIGADLSSWTRPLIGGDSMGQALRTRMVEAGLTPIHVWGMTETGGAGAMLSHDAWDSSPATVGFPFPYVDLRLIDEAEGEIRRPGAVGEIEVRGPGISTRYYREASSSAEQEREGWLRTGDLACYTSRGAVQMMGRASRVINTGGELVAPAVVEEALRELPNIADVIVVGIDDERWGQVVGALVQRAPSARGSSPTNLSELSASASREGVPHEDSSHIRALLRDSLAPWQLPRHLVWVDALPTTTTGKPDIETARRLVTEGMHAHG